MTERERFLETILFGKPDRVPFEPGQPRESTIRAWRTQGLPADADWSATMREIVGVGPRPALDRVPVWAKQEMNPMFEEKIVEEHERTLIVQDWKGNICEISRDFDVTYLRLPKDFVTRKWIRCPVENRTDWEDMKRRYNPGDPDRIPPDIAEFGKKLRGRPHVTGLKFNGPFWQLREWVGFENLCMMFIDDPEFVREMISFWRDFIARLMERVLPHVDVDYVYLSEDMAYKEKAMISPAMTREFLMPCWKAWNEIIREHNCPVYMMDSDGYVGELIPLWIESGIDECDPIEVAAGNDINAYRRLHGSRMAFSGGVDKRAMAKGGEVIRCEMERIEPVVKSGGYIPSCDHGIPSDVGWPQFLEYCDLLAKVTGWK